MVSLEAYNLKSQSRKTFKELILLNYFQLFIILYLKLEQSLIAKKQDVTVREI